MRPLVNALADAVELPSTAEMGAGLANLSPAHLPAAQSDDLLEPLRFDECQVLHESGQVCA